MRPLGWGVVAFACTLGAVLFVALSWQAAPGEQVLLLSTGKARARHVAHKERGSKYSRELAELSREAEPNRRSALAEIDAMQKRADKTVHDDKGGNDGLRRLAAAHGIESSKKMLAEIMSLRHYKSSNREIQELAHGFEAHSSVSNRFKNDVNRDVAGNRAREAYSKKQSEAAALRLEAGRKTRDEMMHAVETKSTGTIARALEQTFKPMQGLLRKDELSLDTLISSKQQTANENAIADRAADEVERQMKHRVGREVDRVLQKKETELEHKSEQYISKVHEKAKAALNSVINPDEIKLEPTKALVHSTKTLQNPWNDKIAHFLESTQAYMRQQETDGTTGGGPTAVPSKAIADSASLPKLTTADLHPNVVQAAHVKLLPVHVSNGKLSGEDTAIDATKSELEQQLRSEEASMGKSIKSKAVVSSKAAAVERVHKKATAAAHGSVASQVAGMSERKKKAFQRALNSYL